MPVPTNALANHIAISVSDAEAAVKWYKEVLGLRELVPLQRISTSSPESGPTLKKIYGPELREMKLALLTTGNSVGVEIFEFIDPPYQGLKGPVKFGPNVYAKGGFFHICFTVPDVKAATDRAVSLGGQVCNEAAQPIDGIDAIYVQDPWGNTLEFLPVGWEQFWLEFMSQALEKTKATAGSANLL